VILSVKAEIPLKTCHDSPRYFLDSRRLFRSEAPSFLTTADLKLCRLPPRSPLPFAALPSVSLLPAAPLADDTDKRKQEHDRTEYRFNYSAYPSVPSALSAVPLHLYWLLATSCDAVLLNSTWSLTFWICAAGSFKPAVIRTGRACAASVRNDSAS
jgi:hypothetical protein